MDVAVVRAVDYLSIKETLVGRVAQTEAKREWVDLHGPTDPRLFRPALGPSFACELLLSIGPYAPLYQDRVSCRMNSGLLFWSSGISCHCVLVLTTFGSKFILYLHMNGAP
jgi:hypothetical protein